MREKFADLMHQRWVHWMNYLFQVSTVNEDGSVTIPKDKAERWQRQMRTAYSSLSEQEQASDLAEADMAIEYFSESNLSKRENATQFLFDEKDVINDNKQILFEQYKLYVELADKVSERRHQANSFFLTVNTALATAITALAGMNQEYKTSLLWLLIPSAVGMVFSISWRTLIKSYSQLNEGKYKIIHELEKRLPAKLFFAEWEVLARGDGTIYTPFTKIEKTVPMIFAFLYFLLALGAFF